MRRLFRYLFIADVAAALEKGKEKENQLQSDMETAIEKIDSDRKSVIGGEVISTLQGPYERFHKDLEMARKLRRFCDQHGVGALFYLFERLDDRW